MTYRFIVLLLACTLLAACAEPMNKAQKGALIGAISGALAGQAIGKDTKGTLIGAASGAAVGGGVGYYMDRQEAAAREALASVEGVNIIRNGEELLVTFSSDNQFAVGSFTFNPAAQQDVARLGQVLVEYDETVILIAGHTDSTGSEDVNQTLSERRATAVKNILLAQGVAADRLTTIGFGESTPIADNGTSYGRQQNRRVEIKMSPK
ncbi:MAG: hypothetical protein C0618_06605 [Desulfuromonas sp.]|nr:MAG: hypothetical protein C0618_06605 [Desulfuromonas sp.]